MPACIHGDLEYTICARNKRRRADCGCPAIGVAHVLYIDLSADASECIRMQDISLAGFACCEDEIAREEHWSLRSHVRVVRVFRSPGRRREPIFQLQRRRKLQDRVAVIPSALSNLTVAHRDIEIARCVHTCSRWCPDTPL